MRNDVVAQQNDITLPAPLLNDMILFNSTSEIMQSSLPFQLSTMKLSLWLFTAVAHATLGDVDLQQPLATKPSTIPLLGFGTWNIPRSNAPGAVSAALQAGYRHLDCAKIYGNQKEVGEGIADGLNKTGLKRSDIWITSKLWNDQYASVPID